MNHRLNLDIKDPNYTLLKEIFKVIDSRKSEEILASYGFKNIKKHIFTYKIVFICMFFGLDVKFVLNELESKNKLCKFFNISEILSANQVYKYLSIENPDLMLKALNSILNSVNKTKRRGKKTFIVDATPVDLDFNFKRNKKSKKDLEKINLKWSYSSSKGFYIGFKTTVVLDYQNMKPVAILIHSGAPNDTKLFNEILQNLQKRRIIKKWDILIFDKGYYSYTNYQLGISKYKIVPFIFPKDNFKPQKLKDQLSYPLNVFKVKKQNKTSKKNIWANIWDTIQKTSKLEKIQTNQRNNRRFFQITQTRTQFKTNTQIHTKISEKNRKSDCIFRSTAHNTRLHNKNRPTKAFWKLKNSDP